MGTQPKKKPTNQPSRRAVDVALVAAWLLVAYLMGSKALDSGSWWYYLGGLTALCLSARSLKIFVTRTHGTKH